MEGQEDKQMMDAQTIDGGRRQQRGRRSDKTVLGIYGL